MIEILGYTPAQVRKAIAGAIAGAAPMLAVAVADLHITSKEAGGILGAAVLGFGAVFATKNTPSKRQG